MLNDASPPSSLSPALQALWRLAKGDWEQAHTLVQNESDAHAAWVHAHLHRVEGDLANAGYWYRKAGRSPSESDLETERDAIAETLLGAG
jgi:hypothetical protein